MPGHLRGSSCYLVGPIENDPNHGSDWRSVVSPRLHDLGIKVYNPLDRPAWMKLIKPFIPPDMKRDEILRGIKQDMLPIINAQTITRRICKRFVATCDFVFCYLTDTKTYGTTEELADASTMGKPIIAVIPGGHPSLWLYDILRGQPTFDTTEDALIHLADIDGGAIEIDALRWIFVGDDYEPKRIMSYSG